MRTSDYESKYANAQDKPSNQYGGPKWLSIMEK